MPGKSVSNKDISSLMDRIADLLDAKAENQCTVVTESRGAVKGKRVIWGRERECEEYYGG
jgi:putative hydrolase